MDLKVITDLYEATYRVITLNVADVTHEQSLIVPAAGGNCLNWVMGHIVANRSIILRIAGEAPLWTEAQAAPYARGSAALDPAKPGSARPLEELVADFNRSQTLLRAALARHTPDRLEGPGWEGLPGSKMTLGGQLAFFNFHEAYHGGQTGLLRRIAGLAGAIQ